MFSGFLLAILLPVFQPTWVPISNPQERCVVQNCSVEVKAAKVGIKYVDKKKIYSTSVHYQEDEFYLDSTLRKRIRDFLQKHPKQKRFVVTGFTDGCGSHQYNKELSRKRAQEVSRYVLSLRSGSRVTMRWVGEASGEHTIRARRVDISVTKKVQVPLVPPKIIADFYLIDSSGSMADGGVWDAWIYAIKYWKPKNSRVFVSTTEYVPRGRELANVRPNGGTEIWFSYYQLLDRMKPGQTLVIISDFDSDVKLSAREHQMIEKKVKSKGVRVYAIPL
jgi:outer membrane protein OmpA-like peptidoglycan-associated protein